MTAPFVLGWEEWVALPELGLPALKAKVDTGARTSALHAFAIEPFGPAERPKVRFGVHPVPERKDIEVYCSANVIDRREVTSSNGETELRYVIGSHLKIGDHVWPIEVSLTNRETMSYRMLIGRQAISGDVMVNPGLSFQQPILDYSAYDDIAGRPIARRTLRICLLTREPGNYSGRRLREAAEARGHELETVDTARCTMSINVPAPRVHFGDQPLPFFDAVVPRIGASMTFYGMAVVRQFEMMGCYCVNRADAIGVARDKLLAHQTLARHRVPTPATAFAHSAKDTRHLIDLIGGPPLVLKLLTSTQGKGVMLAETRAAALGLVDTLRGLDANFIVQEFIAEAAGADIRCFVVGGRVVAAMQRQAARGDFRANLHSGGTAERVKLTKEERKLAVKAARVIGLNVAGVDLLRSKDGPKVLEVNSSPGLEGIEAVSGKDIAGMIIDHAAENVRSLVHVPDDDDIAPAG
ncbi:MAG: 30S ribosomal protein S6--L-glutamate ligase [Hyphomicrobiaceae bacterium]